MANDPMTDGPMAGRCTNAEPGTFNHECGKPARWIGTHASGHRQAFCDRHKAEGYEARGVRAWAPVPSEDA